MGLFYLEIAWDCLLGNSVGVFDLEIVWGCFTWKYCGSVLLGNSVGLFYLEICLLYTSPSPRD